MMNDRTLEAKERVQKFVALHGQVKVSILCGGVAAVLGSMLPFSHVNTMFGVGTSFSIVQMGFYGILALAIAAFLGALPIFLRQYQHLHLVAFGLSCAMFSIFFAAWLAASGLAGLIGGAVGGFSVGFYLNLLGYAIMVVGYYLLQTTRTEIAL